MIQSFTLMFILIMGAADPEDDGFQKALEGLQSEYVSAEKSAAELAIQLRVSSDKETKQDPRRDELRKSVETAFNLRSRIQSLQLDQAEANVKLARERLSRRAELASSIIERRVAELLGADELAWLSRDEISVGVLAEATQPPELIDGPATDPQGKRSPPDNSAAKLLGIVADPVTVEEIKSLNESMRTQYKGGLRIQQVIDGSIAAKQGIRTGDILLGIGGWQTATQFDLFAIYWSPKLKDLDRWKFFIIRNNQTLFGHFDMSKQNLDIDNDTPK